MLTLKSSYFGPEVKVNIISYYSGLVQGINCKVGNWLRLYFFVCLFVFMVVPLDLG